MCNQKVKLFLLCAQKSAALFDLNESEVFFIEAVKYAQQDLISGMSEKIYSKALFDIFLNPNIGSLEFVCFCAHMLKLPTLRQKLEEFYASESSLRKKNAAEQVLKSYSDEWEDKDLYSSLKNA